ncbi:MAG: 4-hydroxy-3-methylbut-2-enyl diphosphate reductase [Bacteroidales bacterium]|nr:4-hydroxy-3-methylbut-2-enyl diphosphate reductase [Bacteroidales bacterium]
MTKVAIDPHSGFCGGVIRAIGTAERFLTQNGSPLYSLGAIVHNEEELSRLGALGLETVDIEQAARLEPGSTVLIRAHGEPPATYGRLRKAGLEVIDCTCPVVLRLQEQIRQAAEHGQVLIFGKIGHPEVLGLVGQTGGRAVVVENMEGLRNAIASGSVKPGEPIALFSQTTKSPEEYEELAAGLGAVCSNLTVHRTICAQVSSRHERLSEFAAAHDVIVFVSGNTSSNGKVLYDWCKGVNPRTWHICSAEELRPEWFDGAESAGVCGATSTPRWLLENVARTIENLH